MKTHGRQNSMFFVVLTAAAVLVSSAFAGVNVWPSGGPNASSIDSLSIASSDPAAGRAPFQESPRPTRRLPAYQAIAGVPSPSIEPEVVNVAALPDAKARQLPKKFWRAPTRTSRRNCTSWLSDQFWPTSRNSRPMAMSPSLRAIVTRENKNRIVLVPNLKFSAPRR